MRIILDWSCQTCRNAGEVSINPGDPEQEAVINSHKGQNPDCDAIPEITNKRATQEVQVT